MLLLGKYTFCLLRNHVFSDFRSTPTHMHACMYMPAHTHTHTYATCTHTHKHTHAHTHTCTHTHTTRAHDIYTHPHTYTHHRSSNFFVLECPPCSLQLLWMRVPALLYALPTPISQSSMLWLHLGALL